MTAEEQVGESPEPAETEDSGEDEALGGADPSGGLASSSRSAAPLACSLAGQSEKLKSPWPGINTALQQLKHQHVISALLILIQNIAPYQLL